MSGGAGNGGADDADGEEGAWPFIFWRSAVASSEQESKKWRNLNDVIMSKYFPKRVQAQSLSSPLSLPTH